MTNIQTKRLLHPTLTLNEAQERIRLTVKDAFFKRQIATLDNTIKKLIDESLSEINIPTLKEAARRSLTAFYREQRRIIGSITPAMLITYLSLLKLSGGGVKPSAGDSAMRQYTASITRSVAKKTVAELPEYLEFATPLKTYTKNYFNKYIEPTITRLAEAEALDPDSKYYLGRRETLRTRAEREVRHESHINEIANLKANGTRLVIISSHANCSERCRPFQGKVFSLDGTSGKTDDGREYKPIENATDIYTDNGKWKNGLFGFNCRHHAIPYSKGYKPPVFSAKTEKKQYEIEQKQRYLERGVRHWRIKAAEYKGLDDEAYKKARLKADAWTKRYQEYSVQNKRAWDPYRIRIDAPKHRYQKSESKGLAAKIGSEFVPLHDEPILLKEIDVADTKAVQKTLTDYEKKAILEPIETACVITKDGKVYKCFGSETNVHPEFDLGDNLYGAIVSHNHPIEKTEYTLSREDITLFKKYNLQVLRGCDEKYTYEMTRNSNEIDEIPSVWDSEEIYHHAVFINVAKSNGFGYRRWKNEKS